MVDHDGRFATYMQAQGFIAPELPTERPGAAALEAADQRARFWTSPQAGPIRLGSEEHKRAICAMFRDTFNAYRPSIIAWPKLSDEMRRRVTSLPIWDIAVHTESRARLRFAAYAGAIADPELRDAIMLNAWEESRHKEVLADLVRAYGIELAEEPAFEHPRDPEWFYLVTGYCECIDSFFAFGLFELARQSGFFPPELVETFEPVIQEECRHILLFANLVAWQRANLSPWQRLRFELRILRVWAYIAYERIVLARSLTPQGHGAGQDTNFTASTAQSMAAVELNARDLMAIALRENDRRFAGYDPRLVRPTTIPRLARFFLAVTRPFARKSKPAADLHAA
ncbi:MAG: hypothetical protein U1E23_05535 [Reyranellaceae bacterium]